MMSHKTIPMLSSLLLSYIQKFYMSSNEIHNYSSSFLNEENDDDVEQWTFKM